MLGLPPPGAQLQVYQLVYHVFCRCRLWYVHLLAIAYCTVEGPAQACIAEPSTTCSHRCWKQWRWNTPSPACSTTGTSQALASAVLLSSGEREGHQQACNGVAGRCLSKTITCFSTEQTHNFFMSQAGRAPGRRAGDDGQHGGGPHRCGAGRAHHPQGVLAACEGWFVGFWLQPASEI